MSSFDVLEPGELTKEFFEPPSGQTVEPMAIAGLGLSVDHLVRAGRRGLLLHSADKQPDLDDSEAVIVIRIIPDTPAERLGCAILSLPTDEAEGLWDSFYRDAFHEEDDERFETRWAEYI